MSFTEKDIIIEKLKADYVDIIKHFKSEVKDLEDFLKEDAFNNQNQLISVTYLVFDIKKENLLAYITLLTDSLIIKEDENLKKYFREHGIHYLYLPALKIGRLCVDDRYRRENIGTLLIKFAIQKAWEINEKCGCRFITIDAKVTDDEDSPVEFYKKLGFKELTTKEKAKKTIPMYLDIFIQ